MVGLAVLSLLSEVAEEQPLLCIVDDAQWLDRVSAQTLTFVARRLLAERVGLVFALRGDVREFGGLPELALRGIEPLQAGVLLDSTVPGPLDERVRDAAAAAFLQRAAETVPRRTAHTRDVLTAQEAQVALLAADGQTDPEIGAQLFISPRTVEYHLRTVFTKLGIRSRKELTGALGAR
jgi:DNA-binding CsgD family transcriptional regulator